MITIVLLLVLLLLSGTDLPAQGPYYQGKTIVIIIPPRSM